MNALAVIEDSNHTPPHPHGSLDHEPFKPGVLSHPVDGTENVEDLPPHRGVRLERDARELRRQSLNRPVPGKFDKVGLEAAVVWKVDADMGVPPSTTHRVPGDPQRRSPEVTDGCCLVLEERVAPVGRQDDELPIEPDVLKTRDSLLFPAGPRPL